MPIRVILVDDHAVVRSGLRRVLEAGSDIEVVGEASNVRDAVFEVRAHKPDVIVMDVVMPGASGIEGTPLVLHEAPDAKVLVLSMQDDPRYVREAFAQGASGYVLKEAADTEVVEAVRQVAGGQQYLHPALGARLLESEARQREEDASEPEAQPVHLAALRDPVRVVEGPPEGPVVSGCPCLPVEERIDVLVRGPCLRVGFPRREGPEDVLPIADGLPGGDHHHGGG